MKLIVVNIHSGIPKYKQIVQSIELAIAENRLKKGDRLPSVNKVSLEFSISRDTVLLAYDELKKRGIVYAILGKGYYVKSIEFSFEQRFFVLFAELNGFKGDLYTSFFETKNLSTQKSKTIYLSPKTLNLKLLNLKLLNFKLFLNYWRSKNRKIRIIKIAQVFKPNFLKREKANKRRIILKLKS